MTREGGGDVVQQVSELQPLSIAESSNPRAVKPPFKSDCSGLLAASLNTAKLLKVTPIKSIKLGVISRSDCPGTERLSLCLEIKGSSDFCWWHHYWHLETCLCVPADWFVLVWVNSYGLDHLNVCILVHYLILWVCYLK